MKIFLVSVLDVTCTPQGVWHTLIFVKCLFQKICFWEPIGELVETIFKHLILGVVHTSYTPTFTLIVKLEKMCFPYEFSFLFN